MWECKRTPAIAKLNRNVEFFGGRVFTLHVQFQVSRVACVHNAIFNLWPYLIDATIPEFSAKSILPREIDSQAGRPLQRRRQ